MKQNKKYFIIIALLAIFFRTDLVTASDAQNSEPQIDKPAPTFTATGTKKQHKLSDYQGKYLVLEWFNPECPFVKKHYDSKNMQKLQQEYTGKDVVWLSVNSSAPGKQGHLTKETAVKIWQDKQAAPTDIILDGEGVLGHLYAARTTPHMFVINPKGDLIYQGAIDSVRSTDKEDIPEAKNYVKMALDQAMSGKAIELSNTPPYGCSVKY